MKAMILSATITVTLPDDCAGRLAAFEPVEGTWEARPGRGGPCVQHLVPAFAKDLADSMCGGPKDWPAHIAGTGPVRGWKVDLFRADGRSLEGSDGITEGTLLITRT